MTTDPVIQIVIQKVDIDKIAEAYDLKLNDEDYEHIARHFDKSKNGIMDECWDLIQSIIEEM